MEYKDGIKSNETDRDVLVNMMQWIMATYFRLTSLTREYYIVATFTH